MLDWMIGTNHEEVRSRRSLALCRRKHLRPFQIGRQGDSEMSIVKRTEILGLGRAVGPNLAGLHGQVGPTESPRLDEVWDWNGCQSDCARISTN